jgi:hypothetical protein
MEAIEQLIKTQESEISAFWKRNSQSNPGAHMEFREMRKELNDLLKEREQLKQKIETNLKQNPTTKIE